ncbi:TPA: hypothetical protein ACQ31S_001995 [Yersinia enterocolitica]
MESKNMGLVRSSSAPNLVSNSVFVPQVVGLQNTVTKPVSQESHIVTIDNDNRHQSPQNDGTSVPKETCGSRLGNMISVGLTFVTVECIRYVAYNSGGPLLQHAGQSVYNATSEYITDWYQNYV